MRRTYGFLFISSLVFGSAVGFTRQNAPLAEQQFKNIQSFKGEKASAVIPAMEFMSGSLGQKCDFCHTEDRASDDKEAKKTAREMITMQHDINVKFFRGRTTITCASCHNGHTRPMSVPPITGMEVRARRSRDIKPEDILVAYGKASGMDNSHIASGLKLRGTSIEKGEKTPIDVTYDGAKYAYSAHGPKADNRQGFNGTLAWFTTEHGIQAVPFQYAIQYVNMKKIFTGPSSLPKLENPTGGTAKLSGRDDLVVTGTIEGDTTRLALYFDKQTGLLSRTVFSYPTILGSIAQINDYSDYRKVDGVQLPMTVVNHTSEGDTTIQYRSVRTGSKVDATSFDPPKS